MGRPEADVNLSLAGLLLDLAHINGETQRAWGYKRAAKAVLRIEQSIAPLVEANTFRAIPGIGPTTDRIARELIFDGGSAFVEKAVGESGKEEKLAGLRSLRVRFVSGAGVKSIWSGRGTPSVGNYRGDFQMPSVGSAGAEPLDSIVE